MSTVKSDIEIAREAKMKPIMEIGAKLGIPAEGPHALRPQQGQGVSSTTSTA